MLSDGNESVRKGEEGKVPCSYRPSNSAVLGVCAALHVAKTSKSPHEHSSADHLDHLTQRTHSETGVLSTSEDALVSVTLPNFGHP